MPEILTIIPARGGSKGIKNKNIKKMLNKPLIYWTIKQIKKINKKSTIIVSTDSKKIRKISLKYNISVPFIRPKIISKDYSSDYDLINHAINFFKKKNIYFKYILLLQPTSPLRTYKDINQSIKYAMKNKIKTLVTFTKIKSEHPNYLFKINKRGLTRYLRKKKSVDTIRQKVDNLYYPEGSIFFSEIKTYLKYKSFYNKYTMPFFLEKWKSIEVDDIEDFKLTEQLLRIQNRL